MRRTNLATLVTWFILHEYLMTSVARSEPQHFKMGILAPMETTSVNIQGIHSVSAATLAMDAVHNDSELGANIRLR